MTATCHRLRPETYAGLLEAEARRLESVVVQADPDLPVPTCPKWSVANLVEHIGGVHRWAELHLRLRSPRRISAREVELGDARATGYATWLEQGIALLVATARATPPDTPTWAWGSDKHARFWPRRMLHETTVHRADLELALELTPIIDPSTAVDGIDEFLDNLPFAEYFAPNVRELRGSGEVIGLSTTDSSTTWAIELGPDGFTWEHSPPLQSAVNVEATAAELLLFVYGRRGPESRAVTVTGDAGVLDRWRTNSQI